MYSRAVLVARLTLECSLLCGCADRALSVEDYGPCEQDLDCESEAICAASESGSVNVCRPLCATDDDCPGVDGASAQCGIGGFASGVCVISPVDGDCPKGMFLAAVVADPTSPLVCVWGP